MILRQIEIDESITLMIKTQSRKMITLSKICVVDFVEGVTTLDGKMSRL